MCKTKQPNRKTRLPNRKTKFELFHSSTNFFVTVRYDWGTTGDEIRQAFLRGEYQLVDTFKLPGENIPSALEEVFFRSQNLDRSWRRGSPTRSTSVGDVVRVGKDYWIVAGTGFDLGWQD